MLLRRTKSKTFALEQYWLCTESYINNTSNSETVCTSSFKSIKALSTKSINL